jgi:dTMP kinase
MIKLEFEGTDGAGKTTGLKYFIERAKAKGLSVVETREVGNPNVPVCVKMRELVLDPNSGLGGEAMELVFAAMRYENDRWLQNLQDSGEAPDLVVSDRGYFSHLAYTDHNVSPEFTEQLYLGLITGTTKLPDVVIYFNVNTETALKRRVKRGETMDVIEMKGIEFQEKVRGSFLSYIDDCSEYSGIDFYNVDANDTLEGVKAQLDTILEEIVNT